MHEALIKQERPIIHGKLLWNKMTGDGHVLGIRLVNPDQDLPLFSDWLNDPMLETNWAFQENFKRIRNHILHFLESDNRQSFFIVDGDRPIFQFDIFLIHFHELYFRLPTTSGDCILNYLILFRQENISLIPTALTMQLDYFFSYPDCRRIWISIPEEKEEMKSIFTAAGFIYRTSYTARQQRYALFYLKRAAYATLS